MRALRAVHPGSVRKARAGRTVIATNQAPNSEEPGMLRSRLILVTFLLAVCAACGPKAAHPQPTAISSASTPTDPSSPASTQLAGYTHAERSAYAAAARAYDAFAARNDKIMAEARTTVAARDFYQKYTINWPTAWTSLAQLANNHITISGPTTTKWTRPQTVDLTARSGPTVVLRRCIDETKRVVTQHGNALGQPQFRTPHVYVVTLQQKAGESWWRAGAAKRGATC